MITHLPASQRNPQPWKNGGGITREIATFPDGAGMDDFAWRISMAEVSDSGPFSAFPGVDRHLTVLSGRLQLDFADRQYVLNPGRTLTFEGDAPVSGTPLMPVIDLNVMTRRGQASAEVRQVLSGFILPSDLVIFVATKPMTVTANGARYELAQYDALKFKELEGEPVSAGDGYLVIFR
jgi:environmental stress-induced protein Ves